MEIHSLTSAFTAIPEDVKGFSHVPGGGVTFGPGTVDRCGELCALQGGASHAFLVSDRGVAAAGHVERVRDSIEAAGLAVTVFDEAAENPTTVDVVRAVEAARGAGIDLIVGLGGGSSMDTAKACNFLLTNGGEMADYRGVGKAKLPMLPFIAVPTTAGTGSECQSFALIADASTHMKMACGDRKSTAAVAILDPELTLTQPGRVTAVTGMDAIAHALETAVCNKRSAVSQAYSRLAFGLMDHAFERVIEDGRDLEARARMQLGAAYAGTAIENSMLGLAHALANPVTARFPVAHGEAIGILLPHVIRFNSQIRQISDAYRDLGRDRLVERIEWLRELAGLPSCLSAVGVGAHLFAEMSVEAARQWTAGFNPRQATIAELEAIYQSAYADDGR